MERFIDTVENAEAAKQLGGPSKGKGVLDISRKTASNLGIAQALVPLSGWKRQNYGGMGRGPKVPFEDDL